MNWEERRRVSSHARTRSLATRSRPTQPGVAAGVDTGGGEFDSDFASSAATLVAGLRCFDASPSGACL